MTERWGAFPILTDNAVVRNGELETTHGGMGDSPGLKHQKIPSLWLQLSPGLISERKYISLVSNEIFTVLTDAGVDSWKFSVRNSGVFFLLLTQQTMFQWWQLEKQCVVFWWPTLWSLKKANGKDWDGSAICSSQRLFTER